MSPPEVKGASALGPASSHHGDVDERPLQNGLGLLWVNIDRHVLEDPDFWHLVVGFAGMSNSQTAALDDQTEVASTLDRSSMILGVALLLAAALHPLNAALDVHGPCRVQEDPVLTRSMKDGLGLGLQQSDQAIKLVSLSVSLLGLPREAVQSIDMSVCKPLHDAFLRGFLERFPKLLG